MGRKFPATIAQSASTNAIASPNPLFSFLNSFQRSRLLAQQAALSLSCEGAALVANHQNLFFHIAWLPPLDLIKHQRFLILKTAGSPNSLF